MLVSDLALLTIHIHKYMWPTSNYIVSASVFWKGKRAHPDAHDSSRNVSPKNKQTNKKTSNKMDTLVTNVCIKGV